MKYFIARLFASISSTQFYKLVLIEPFKRSLSFYLLFLVLISLVMSLEYWIRTRTQLRFYIDSVSQEAVTRYPQDLVVNWNSNELTSSYSFYIDFPQETLSSITQLADKLALVTPVNESSEYSTLFQITPTELQLIDDGEIVRSEKLDILLDTDDFTLSANSIDSQSQRAEEWLYTQLEILGYLYPLGSFIFLCISRAYLILIETTITFLFLKIYRVHWSYRQLLQLIMALFIPAEIINQVAKIAQIDAPTSILSLSFWILFVFVFFSIVRR